MSQLAEQLICNQQVIGSSPIIGFSHNFILCVNGQIPEWPKGTDCKSAGDAFEGSNPSPPIRSKNKKSALRNQNGSNPSPPIRSKNKKVVLRNQNGLNFSPHFA